MKIHQKKLIGVFLALLLASANVFASDNLKVKSTCPNLSPTEIKAQTNKEVVLNFYQKMFGDKDLTAVDEYILPEYIQHNPNVADGATAFKAAAEIWFQGAEKTKIDVQHIAAEGDFVFIHLKNTNPDGSLKSTIDIFRLENGKIIEHWDVHQNVPEKSANPHPMF